MPDSGRPARSSATRSAGPLQTSVHQRLDDLARAATLPDQRTAELAREEIPLLVHALRAVLADHEPDARGRCRTCRKAIPWWRLSRRRNALPCRAYLAVQLRLGTLETVRPPRSGGRARPAHLRSVG